MRWGARARLQGAVPLLPLGHEFFLTLRHLSRPSGPHRGLSPQCDHFTLEIPIRATSQPSPNLALTRNQVIFEPQLPILLLSLSLFSGPGKVLGVSIRWFHTSLQHHSYMQVSSCGPGGLRNGRDLHLLPLPSAGPQPLSPGLHCRAQPIVKATQRFQSGKHHPIT